MKKSCALFFIFLSGLNISSQIKHDIIYLHNGSIIKGKISDDTSVHVKIYSLRENTYMFNKSEISEIRHHYNRYINYTSAGFLMGSAWNEKPTVLSVLSEHNFQFLNHFALGGLLGIELINETTIPLAANLKIYLPVNNSTVYLNGSWGYSFSADEPRNFYYYELLEKYGGPMAGLEFGLIIPLNYSNGLFFAMGYRYNELEYKYEYWDNRNVYRSYYYNRLSMRFGVVLY